MHGGAEVPFMRPAELADDHTGTIPVIAHAIEWYRQHGEDPAEVCCIYATAPFVRAEDLRVAWTCSMQTGCDYAFSVTSYAFPIQRAIRITAAGRVEMFSPEHFNTRSQDLEEAYHDAGQFYWGRGRGLAGRQADLFGDAAPVILPRYRVQDIDTPEDWERAEWMFKALQSGRGVVKHPTFVFRSRRLARNRHRPRHALPDAGRCPCASGARSAGSSAASTPAICSRLIRERGFEAHALPAAAMARTGARRGRNGERSGLMPPGWAPIGRTDARQTLAMRLAAIRSTG